MGKYINTNSSNLPIPPLGKVEALVSDGANIIQRPSVWGENIVCVADNGFFECAAYIYSQDELEAFAYPCGRPKTWLNYPHAKQLAR